MGTSSTIPDKMKERIMRKIVNVTESFRNCMWAHCAPFSQLFPISYTLLHMRTELYIFISSSYNVQNTRDCGAEHVTKPFSNFLSRFPAFSSSRVPSLLMVIEDDGELCMLSSQALLLLFHPPWDDIHIWKKRDDETVYAGSDTDL